MPSAQGRRHDSLKGGDCMLYLIDPSSYTLGAKCRTKHIHPLYGLPVCRQIEL